MNLLNTTKFFNALPPGVIKDDAAFVSNVLDKASVIPNDAKGVLFVCQLGTIDATAAVFRFMESDTQTNATTLGGTPAAVHDVTAKPGDADDNGIVLVYVPLSAWTEQYGQFQATAGDGAAGTYLSVLAIVDAPGDGAPTAAGLGVTTLEVAS
jgi:hypothetical protein